MMGVMVKKSATSLFSASFMEMVTFDVTSVDDVICIGFMNGAALSEVYCTVFFES